MRRVFAFTAVAILAGGMLSAPLSAAPVPGKVAKADSPAIVARKALDEVGDFHYQARSLNDVIAELKDRTRVNITLDPLVMNFGLDPSLPTVNVEMKQARLRDVLKATLAPHSLRAGLVRDGLYISHEEGVTAHQLRQTVSVDCDGTPFDKAIAALITDSGANVVIDPRLKEKAAAPVVLKLDDVPMETAIRLLAEVADLRAVRMSNVMFVTTPERAKALRMDADGPLPPAQPSPGVQQLNIQNGVGGAGGVGIAVPAIQVAPPVREKAEPEKP